MARDRGHWSSRAGFVLAASGSAIGLGNLWKFPYITWENQGGAFVLVYLLCILVVGLPIMIAEILIGRMTQKSPVGALREAVGPAWGFVGGLGVFTGFVILGYYAVIAGWSLRSFVLCLGWSFNGYTEGAAAEGFGPFLGQGFAQIGLAGLFLLVTVFVVRRGIAGGIERVARTLMPVLFAILIILLGRALFLDGSGEALKFIFAPRFGELKAEGILEALGHSFFTLSLGMGAMITYGSYLHKDQSVVSASWIVVVLDTLIAIVATVIMFAVIFSVPGMREEIGKSTAGMLFLTLPELFYTKITFGAVLAPLFYILVAFAALTSTISLLEVAASYFIDQRKMSRGSAVALCGGATFVLSILCGLSLGAVDGLSTFELWAGKAGVLTTLDHLASNWLLPFGGFFLTLAVGWFMSQEDKRRELRHAPSWFRFEIWRFFMRWVAPVAVGAILVAVIMGKDFS